MMVLDAIYRVSWAWSSVNPVMLVQLWRKLLPYLEEDDFKSFPNEEVSKSKILDMVCFWKKNNEGMLKNDYRLMCVKWASSTWQADNVNAATKQRGEEEGGEDENEIPTAMRRSFT
jgi:hypothetical protein